MAHKSPDPDLFYSLYTGIFKPQMTRLAIQIDLFSMLDDGPLSCAELAETCQCHPQGLQSLLDYLVAVQLLSCIQGKYSNTPTSAAFLNRRRKSFAGDWFMVETSPAVWDGFLQALRYGQPAYPIIPFEQDAWLESYRTPRLESSLEMWHAAGIDPMLNQPIRILDIACGCGIKSFALLQTNPSARVVCIDRPEVLDVSTCLAGRMGVRTRSSFRKGDLSTISLGSSEFNAALLGQITYYLTPDQNLDLFDRIFTALLPGGLLLIDAAMRMEQPEEASSMIDFLTWASSGGGAYPFDAYKRWLLASGYQMVEQIGSTWLKAVK